MKFVCLIATACAIVSDHRDAINGLDNYDHTFGKLHDSILAHHEGIDKLRNSGI